MLLDAASIPLGGTDVATVIRTVTAEKSVKGGNFVVLATGGTVEEADASSTALYGRAVHDAAAGEEVVVELAMPDVAFLMTCTGTLNANLVGDHVDLEVSSGYHYVNEDAGATKVFKIHEVVDTTAKTLYVIVPATMSQAFGVEVS